MLTTAPASARPSVATPAAWVPIKDPSGVTFQFPSKVAPTVSTLAGSTTRTYIANAGGGAVASIVIIPTPVALNVKNFFIQYPIKLRTQGNTAIRSEGVRDVSVKGLRGFQTAVSYLSPPLQTGSGPSYVFEEREAIQMSKYFVVISAVASDAHPLTAAHLAQAKAVNAHLLRGFSAGRT